MNYLTGRQVEILIKLYYLQKYITAAEMLGMSVSQVKTVEEHALRCIRLAYSKSYRQGKKFDGETILCHMAERSRLTAQELANIFDTYITEGLASDGLSYWERVKRTDENPTATELLDFIYMKYELKIDPFTLENYNQR